MRLPVKIIYRRNFWLSEARLSGHERHYLNITVSLISQGRRWLLGFMKIENMTINHSNVNLNYCDTLADNWRFMST